MDIAIRLLARLFKIYYVLCKPTYMDTATLQLFLHYCTTTTLLHSWTRKICVSKLLVETGTGNQHGNR